MTHCNTHDHHLHHDSENEETSCVSLVPIFNHLEGNQMEEIMRVTHPITFTKGQTIYQAGDRSDSLYIVSEGKIRITRMAESGKEQLLRVLLPGHFAGELSLFSESIHEDYALAMEDTSVCTIHRKEFQDLLLKYPSIAMKVLAEFSKRLEQSERQAARVATEKVETRLAHYLIEILGKDPSSFVVELPMTKKDLASYLATTPESLSRKLSDFEKEGFIRLLSNRKIKILDSDALMKQDVILKKKQTLISDKTDLGELIENELTRLKIGQPAARALLNIGVVTLKDLTKISEKTVLNLHGVGPKAIRLLKEALEQEKLTFL